MTKHLGIGENDMLMLFLMFLFYICFGCFSLLLVVVVSFSSSSCCCFWGDNIVRFKTTKHCVVFELCYCHGQRMFYYYYYVFVV